MNKVGTAEAFKAVIKAEGIRYVAKKLDVTVVAVEKWIAQGFAPPYRVYELWVLTGRKYPPSLFNPQSHPDEISYLGSSLCGYESLVKTA